MKKKSNYETSSSIRNGRENPRELLLNILPPDVAQETQKPGAIRSQELLIKSLVMLQTCEFFRKICEVCQQKNSSLSESYDSELDKNCRKMEMVWRKSKRVGDSLHVRWED